MPKETDRLKLPLPLGNENVTRESINGIFEKIDAGVATEKEVRDAHELASSKQNVIKLANNFAAPDTAITAYPEGYSVFYVGGGTGGQGGVWRTTVGATEAFGYVETVRVGTGGIRHSQRCIRVAIRRIVPIISSTSVIKGIAMLHGSRLNVSLT